MAKLFDSPEMRETLRRLVRAEMAFKGMEYRDLSEQLAELGVVQTEGNLRSKVNNGSLGAQLFVYLLMAMDVDALDMQRVRNVLADVHAAAEDTAQRSGAAQRPKPNRSRERKKEDIK